ncbi:hypothetical protein [Actinoplanes sp. NBRC 101535]|uniref:hypothetical protein n=1 Tax=Actinoplanes sp. NBRC 101535 TaxID=3032196 RepID=UPI0024A3CC11|nr:hypothetical protein [Actinoplanes sp. NBRC 101535]GLY05418.1 hypothetical protein Acsp01_57970 [Actinoplanes sp. NBRC 101535]
MSELQERSRRRFRWDALTIGVTVLWIDAALCVTDIGALLWSLTRNDLSAPEGEGLLTIFAIGSLGVGVIAGVFAGTAVAVKRRGTALWRGLACVLTLLAAAGHVYYVGEEETALDVTVAVLMAVLNAVGAVALCLRPKARQ